MPLIETEEIKQRVDVAASNRLRMLSRAYVRKLIDDGRITVNGEISKAGYRLRAQDSLEINFDPDEIEQIASIDLPVLYEDNDVIVVNKPAGVISHARGRFWNEPSVASFVRERSGQGGEREGIVHRLDRATSGVMICAKNPTTLAYLQKQFADRSTAKTYYGVVAGTPETAKALIDMPIIRNPKAPQTFRVGQNGKPSTTNYEVVKSAREHTLLKLTPLTGRTHQLRVHLAHIGHPIVGDTLYEGEAADRLFLHAFSLTINIPGDKKMTFEAPLPAEFDKIISQ